MNFPLLAAAATGDQRAALCDRTSLPLRHGHTQVRALVRGTRDRPGQNEVTPVVGDDGDGVDSVRYDPR
jgi:hypothetical protein